MRHAVIGYCACELTSLAGSAFASSVERRLASLVRGAGALEAGDLRSLGDRRPCYQHQRVIHEIVHVSCVVCGVRDGVFESSIRKRGVTHRISLHRPCARTGAGHTPASRGGQVPVPVPLALATHTMSMTAEAGKTGTREHAAAGP